MLLFLEILLQVEYLWANMVTLSKLLVMMTARFDDRRPPSRASRGWTGTTTARSTPTVPIGRCPASRYLLLDILLLAEPVLKGGILCSALHSRDGRCNVVLSGVDLPSDQILLAAKGALMQNAAVACRCTCWLRIPTTHLSGSMTKRADADGCNVQVDLVAMKADNTTQVVASMMTDAQGAPAPPRLCPLWRRSAVADQDKCTSSHDVSGEFQLRFSQKFFTICKRTAGCATAAAEPCGKITHLI